MNLDIKVENIHSIGHSAFGFNNYLKHQLIKDTSRIYKDNQNWFEDLSDKKLKIYIFMVLVLRISI